VYVSHQNCLALFGISPGIQQRFFAPGEKNFATAIEAWSGAEDMARSMPRKLRSEPHPKKEEPQLNSSMTFPWGCDISYLVLPQI